MRLLVSAIAILLMAACRSPSAPSAAATPPTATVPVTPGRYDVSIAAGSLTVGGVLFRPDASSPRPGIIVLHGWQVAGTNGAAVVEARARRFADEGYNAIAISLRGWPPSGGVDDCGLRQPDDVAAVAAWLRTQPGVLADRIGIVGFSQGGQVALLAATRDPRLAAIVGYFPVTDVTRWKQTTNNTDIPTYVTQVCEPGGADLRSPALRAREIAAPVLLIHGDADLRVPTQQSYLMHDALSGVGRSSEIAIIPGAQHGFTAAEEAVSRPIAEAFLTRHLIAR